MARLSRSRWPADGPVRDLLSYLESLHATAGHPSLTEIGKALALAPSTLSAFFTGARLISRGNLELLVEYLEGDVRQAELMRRRAVVAWEDRTPVSEVPPELASRPEPVDASPASGSRVDILRYSTPANTLNRPDQLIGRATLTAQLHDLLDLGERVLLYGLGGCGKTALAATVADQRVTVGKGAYLWLRPGSADDDTVLDGITRTLAGPEDRARIAATVGDAQLQTIRQVLSGSDVTLWIIDDVWHPQTLYTPMRVLPERVPVMVTSRLKIDIGRLVDVGDLTPADAVALLSQHARQAVSSAGAALCRELGHHPYALEIAGRHLRQYDMTPADLSTLIRREPHTLSMPGGFAAEGRESVQRLLDRSYQALDSDDARRALGAIAAFSSGTISVELLATYLGFDEARTWTALNRLVDVSLAKRIPATSAYSVHDLTFAYARAGVTADTLPATAAFVRAHARDFPLLAVEMDNILAVAAGARERDPECFLAIVETLATGGYLDDYGHTLVLLRLLDDAIDLVRAEPPRRHTLLTKRGNAAYDQGEYERAIGLYIQALDIAPTPQRRIILLSLVGKVLAELGRHEEADEQFDQAYAMAAATGDEQSRLRILEQHSVAAFRRGDYARVRDLSREGLDLSASLGARVLEAIFLNNLGTAEFELGVCQAIELHTRAQQVAVEIDNDHLRALTHRTLGADYHARERFDAAREQFHEALRLYRKLGQIAREDQLRQLLRRFGYLDPPG